MANTYGLRYGVIYTASPKSLTPWAMRVDPSDQHNQNYGQFLMLSVPEDDGGAYAGQTWMIDTYHFRRPALKAGTRCDADAIIEHFAGLSEASSSMIHTLRWDCYYNACVRLTEDNASLFSEFVDLGAFCYIDDEHVADYDDGDIAWGVCLYREHNYRWRIGPGISMVRKEAQPVTVRQARNIAYKMRCEQPNYLSYGFELEAGRLEKFASEHMDDAGVIQVLDENRDRIEFMREVADAYKRLQGQGERDSGQMSFEWDADGNIIVAQEDDHE